MLLNTGWAEKMALELVKFCTDYSDVKEEGENRKTMSIDEFQEWLFTI